MFAELDMRLAVSAMPGIIPAGSIHIPSLHVSH